MGWARTLLLGDIGNRLDIADTENDIASLRTSLHQQSWQDTTQDKRIEQLELCVATLSRLLVGKGVLSTDELVKIANIIEKK